MELFKRILLSFFPNEIVNQPINPASMFVSFISAKQYFSVINRKIVENYKLNLYDISLDSFDVKIGFGNQPNLKFKDIDFYYSYGVSANLNGYRFYSPSNVSSCLAIVSSLYVIDEFKKYEYNFFSNFLLSIFLFTFLIMSRIKVFPNNDKINDFNWFIELFFNFFRFIINQSKKEIDDNIFEEIKKGLLKNIQVFFMLFYYYKKVNDIFQDNNELQQREYYNLLFSDEEKNIQLIGYINDFIENNKKYSSSPNLVLAEKKLLNLIFPADILIKYVFEGNDIDLVVKHIISNIYDIEQLNVFMSSFLKNGDKFEDFLGYIYDYRMFKEKYFNGLKTLSVYKFKNTNNYDLEEEIDELISSVGEGEGIESVKIPERIKKESALMERFINFYVMFIGSFWIARGDNFFVRLFRRNILLKISSINSITDIKGDSLSFYGGLLFSYTKNVFYYKSAFDNVKAGKEKFNLPFKSKYKEIYSNSFIIKLFNENFVSSVLQDINSKDIKIYIKNNEILFIFKKLLSGDIKNMLKYSDKKIISGIYGKVSSLFEEKSEFVDVLNDNLTKNDLLNLKESFYTLDFWIWYKMIIKLNGIKNKLSQKYSDNCILGISGILRDTIFGLVIYLVFLRYKSLETKQELKISLIINIYLIDILCLSESYYKDFEKVINELIFEFEPILGKWLTIDDNQKYFEFGFENWNLFISGLNVKEILNNIGGEDTIWFRGFLKNITFYNKRFLIQKDL